MSVGWQSLLSCVCRGWSSVQAAAVPPPPPWLTHSLTVPKTYLHIPVKALRPQIYIGSPEGYVGPLKITHGPMTAPNLFLPNGKSHLEGIFWEQCSRSQSNLDTCKCIRRNFVSNDIYATTVLHTSQQQTICI